MAEEFKNVPEYETPKVATTTEESSATGEVKDRGLLNFMGKKEETKPEHTTLGEEFEKVHVSEPAYSEPKYSEPAYSAPAHVEKYEAEERKHEEEVKKYGEEEGKENKPSLMEKLHRSNSSSSSSSDEEDEEKKKKKTEKKPVEGGEEKKGLMEKVKEKLPGHNKKPEEDVSEATPVITTPVVTAPVTEETAEHPTEKKGILEKIKEKLPGYHSKSPEEEEKKEKESAH